MKVTNFFGELSMMPYQASETANRLITRGVAEMMAHDIVKGTGNMNKLALQSLKKFPTDIQMAVNAAKGDQAQIAQVLGEHLNSKTMFNYNRPAMSEYGRFMGPLFSQFSKWPTAIAGEAIQDLRSKGLIRGSARMSVRLALPYALFSAVDYMIATGGDVEETLKAMVPFSEKPELTDKQKVLTGGSGLAGTTPATSLTGFYSGDMFTPPAVDMLVSKTLIPFLKASDNEERQEALGKGLTNSLKTFTGGMQYIRFFTEEYPVLFEGQSYESVKE
jgi:hypothetical protein